MRESLLSRGNLERIADERDRHAAETRLVEYLHRFSVNEDAAPGMGVGIVRGAETIYAKGFGLADAERGRPVSPRTVFRIGSTPP